MALLLRESEIPDTYISVGTESMDSISIVLPNLYPMTKIDPRAVPIDDNILTVLEIKEIEGKRYGYTGWMLNNPSEWIFFLTVTDRLARVYLEQNKVIPSYVLSDGEILIPLYVNLQEEMYREFRIVATLKCSIAHN